MASASAAARDRPRCWISASAIWSPMVSTGLRLVIGSWKIIAIVVAANLPHVGFGQRQQFAAFEPDAALDAAALLRDEPHDGQRGDALARAGFADDRYGLARGDVE